MNHHQNLSQQIKRIHSIEHKKMSSASIVGEPGSFVGSRKHRSNDTPVESINQFSCSRWCDRNHPPEDDCTPNAHY